MERGELSSFLGFGRLFPNNHPSNQSNPKQAKTGIQANFGEERETSPHTTHLYAFLIMCHVYEKLWQTPQGLPCVYDTWHFGWWEVRGGQQTATMQLPTFPSLTYMHSIVRRSDFIIILTRGII